jgi:glycosyltransferase involved in cell wall biosynthesis
MVELSKAESSLLAPTREGRRFRCVIVGGLVPTKRQEDAVRALGVLRRRGADAELVIVGGGDQNYRKLLQSIAASEGVVDRVHFTGPVADAIPFMQQSDTVLVCSEHETFGRATVEGMLAGKPVIAATAAASPELIHNGVTGWLYEPRNPQDLATKIEMLYEDSTLAVRVGECGRSWAQGFYTEERYAQEILPILTNLYVASSGARDIASAANDTLPTSQN